MDFKYKIADVAKEFGVPAKKVIETVSGVCVVSCCTVVRRGTQYLESAIPSYPTMEMSSGTLFPMS